MMAAISGLECLDHPTRQDLVRFSRLFVPLYKTASQEARRTASATLSRLSQVPEDVAEMLINEPIAIAAPFIVHYPRFKETALVQAVMRHGAPHARAAARRSDLSPQAIARLQQLKDPSVDSLLVLRGLIPAPAQPQAASEMQAVPKMQARAPEAATAKSLPSRPNVAAPPLDPSERLRTQLKALVAASPAPQAPLNRPTSPHKRATTQSSAAPVLAEPATASAKARAQRRVGDVRLAQLARHARTDQESWFATALADAMGASFALAERIMMDLSGRQLATAMIGLGAPEATIKSALESFFPHLANPSARHTLATDLIEELDSENCAARLQSWQRADSYTNGAASHVPALADGKPVRQDRDQRVSPRDVRDRMLPSRKTG
ncbi:uncharacterized protein SAMN05877838_2389 [Hoeflea halophila]|uniref:DUF2336 domain-containing protein n=2 Tax=Hoeflea halophila TaxID=714899 RepID=A0A286IDS6_9HYPH|nr:uncharacterized protein SAMN05877838_2389 [Hoeflea halophila]